MSRAIVVDTDVASFLFKNHPIAARYAADLANTNPMLSFMTVAELQRWTLVAHWGDERRSRLQEYVDQFLVMPFTRELCAEWARVMFAAQSRGRRIECADAWIAATALHWDAPLLTHNRADYLGVPGLTVISHE